MCPCSPNDVSVNVPEGPSGPAIPGFGIPFSLSLPNLNPFPDGFPEDLLELLNTLQLLIPPGALKPQLNPNFGKDVFDAIMKLLDQFMPFLMLYKFFLPILNLIICIIEVLCALMNPFKLIRALARLFRTCIPEFLNLFPIFALIIMIISLLLLILALIEYIIAQILKFINTILRNIRALAKAFKRNAAGAVLKIAKKLGALLCVFQNLFVLFAIFNIIIQIIKDILRLIFAIPPCADGDPSNQDGCCTPDVCPSIVKGEYTRTTGSFKYLSQVGVQTTLTLPPPFGNFTFNVRNESWQLYDIQQPQPEQFRNIFDAYDVVILPKPTFFPTDSVYSATTDPKQAPYKLDLRLFYNPASWSRPGVARFIRFKDCIMTHVPSTNLIEGDGSIQNVNNAVALLAGGLGYEDNGTTILTGFLPDGITPSAAQATLENFIHQPAISVPNPILSINDGYAFSNMEYTFKPNIAPLLTKNLVTLGCVPDIAINRGFINNIFAPDIAIKTRLLGDTINGPNFPNPAATQQCLANAVAALRVNMTEQGVAEFQATTNLCLSDLRDKTNQAIGDVITLGFDPCRSSFDVTPPVQFTSKPIIVSVHLNERNGLPLTNGISVATATNLAARIKPHVTFGDITPFTYDGAQLFTAQLTSPIPGTGQIMVSFDNQTFCTNTFPSDVSLPPTHTLQAIDYRFVYTPTGSTIPISPTGPEDTEGTQPRRDAGDQAIDGGTGGKDGV
jgi:hypothetical protein